MAEEEKQAETCGPDDAGWPDEAENRRREAELDGRRVRVVGKGMVAMIAVVAGAGILSFAIEAMRLSDAGQADLAALYASWIAPVAVLAVACALGVRFLGRMARRDARRRAGGGDGEGEPR